MDTSTSQSESPKPDADNPLHVRVEDLIISKLPGDYKTAQKCHDVLFQLLQMLVPVLEYICNLWRFEEGFEVRCIKVGNTQDLPGFPAREVFLSAEGKFFAARPGQHSRKIICHSTKKNIPDTLAEGSADWELLMFDDVVSTLQVTFQEAVKKREKHLEAVKQRTAILDSMVMVMQVGATGPASKQP